MKQLLAPIIGIYSGIQSMLSEVGKQSIKRGISALFALIIAYVVWYFLNKNVPAENQATLKFFFLCLCAMILLLLGIATIKDIIAFKNGNRLPEIPDNTNKEPESK